jgi:hypothetical protein
MKEIRNCQQFELENLKRRDNLGDVSVEGRVILK